MNGLVGWANLQEKDLRCWIARSHDTAALYVSARLSNKIQDILEAVENAQLSGQTQREDELGLELEKLVLTQGELRMHSVLATKKRGG